MEQSILVFLLVWYWGLAAICISVKKDAILTIGRLSEYQQFSLVDFWYRGYALQSYSKIGFEVLISNSGLCIWTLCFINELQYNQTKLSVSGMGFTILVSGNDLGKVFMNHSRAGRSP